MCGIAGIFSNKKISDKYINSMLEMIAHRGPDSEGIVSLFDHRCYLGHRRLSILDLSDAGKQPMQYCNGKYWIVYNGEIYNYIELRHDLLKEGYLFKTETDTEVLLAAYDCWGRDCLHKLNGMWAFVIVNTVTGDIFSARDRFGIKPLYYWMSSHGLFALASEIKQFFGLPGWNGKINGQRCYDFLNWGLMDHTDETMYKGVFQLRAGEALCCHINQINNRKIYKWYELQSESLMCKPEEAMAQFFDIFSDAVRLRLRSDVKIGSCLSGGLDSSSIVCTMDRILKEMGSKEGIVTISSCSKILKYDEKKYVDIILEKIGTNGNFVYPSPEGLFADTKDLIWYQDEPFSSTSIYAQWCVFSAAKRCGIKVMLDGQGADEQLAGYYGFFFPRLKNLMKSFQFKRFFHEMLVTKKLHSFSAIFILKGLLYQCLPDEIYNRLCTMYNGNSLKPSWIDMQALDAYGENPYVVAGNKADSVKSLSIAQLTSSNLQMLLHWEDRNSMAHSIETRLPFLDYRLVEFVLSLPDEYKLSDGITKRILRDSMSSVVPDVVRLRMDKMGFVTPEEVWMREHYSDFMGRLKDAIEVSRGIFTDKAIKHLDDMIDGKKRFDSSIWRIINFSLWLQRMKLV